MFNAKNDVDRGRFVDDLSESIAEMDEMESIKAHNVIETIHFKYQDRLSRHAMMHNTTDKFSPQFRFDNRVDKSLISNCDTRIKVLNKEDSSKSSQLPVIAASTKPAAGPRSRVLAKFSSMLNLSSTTEGVINLNRPTGLLKNQPSLHQNQSRTDNKSSSRNEQVQRRGSTGSVHSLDSGLFLSRDVSPNQSS